MKYLGIDYGKRKIGTAFSEGEIASAGEVLSINGLQEAVTKILAIIAKNEVEIVVIGKPESGESLNFEQNFTQQLQKKAPSLEIIEVSETLSTKHAQDLMLQFNIGQKKRRQDDAQAAALILQEYLDNKWSIFIWPRLNEVINLKILKLNIQWKFDNWNLKISSYG